ncbi:MAG: type I DNA topoisomerase [Candidatus Shapirobacteria bacterium]|jgi:DNA topoisomerase-1
MGDKSLLVVESPTKAKTIGKYLGKDFEVIATVGHLRDLPGNKMSVDIKHGFEPDYKIDPKKKNVVEDLIRTAARVKRVLLATDPDREGEAISWHVEWLLTHPDESKVLKSKSLKVGKSESLKVGKKLDISRITFHEITKDAISDAMGKARAVDMDLVNAQQGRRILDRVVGYTLSPVLWRKVRRGLSGGRVQSVAVRLVCEREKEIEAFKKEVFFKVLAELKKGREKFDADLIKVEEKSAFKTEKIKLFDGVYSFTKSIFEDRQKVTKFVNDLSNQMVVEKVTEKEINRTPLPAFTTSKLQQAAARRFGWPGKTTMSVAQRLFERGFITYHRTDSVYIAEKTINDFRKYIGKTYGEKYISAKIRYYKNTAKNAQEAHEAIRPTDVNRTELADADPRENRLYQMIWKRAVATQGAAAITGSTVVNLRDGGGLFQSKGVRMIFDGFLKINGEKFEDQILPALKEGEMISATKIWFEESETNPPPRYTEASLVSSLEKQGIGRPSTYAPIISTIQIRQYVEKDEGKFIPTALGKAANEFLVRNFSEVLSLPFTADMEGNLDKIAAGKLDWKKMMKTFWNRFEKDVKIAEAGAERVKVETEKLGEKCPECKEGELVIRLGKFGKFISCSRFPECRYTKQYQEVAGFDCPTCGAPVVIKRTRSGKKFYGCSKYPECKWAGWKKP